MKSQRITGKIKHSEIGLFRVPYPNGTNGNHKFYIKQSFRLMTNKTIVFV